MEVSKENKDVFNITEGRVGIRIGRNKPRTFSLPMAEWDNFYIDKVSRGWLLTKTEKMEKKKIECKGISFDSQ